MSAEAHTVASHCRGVASWYEAEEESPAEAAASAGPSRARRWFQTINWQTRPIAFFERCRARYGKRFTIRLLATPPFVIVTDPDEIKEVFTAPPDVLHPGEGARILEPVVGTNSVILLDEGAHLSQRKLMLPAFHGEQMQRLTGADDRGRRARGRRAGRPTAPIESHPRFQALTLEIILRAVFGLDPGAAARPAARDCSTQMATEATKPFSLLPCLQDDWIPRWREFVAAARRGRPA